MGLLDVLAFRAYYRAVLAPGDAAWRAAAVARLEAAYPAELDAIPRLVVGDPNSHDVAAFLRQVAPDLMIARCRVLLKPSVFAVPRLGTYVLHPGICPEYRNAHGCFWALARRDLDRVGMTLLRIDEGVDTGPIYLHASCAFDECAESHVVIQERVVLENLGRIARVLTDLHHGEVTLIPVAGRASAVWGHPRLSAYLRWKHAAKRARHARHVVAS
jgi:methionyl-tRNA formyltransferase